MRRILSAVLLVLAPLGAHAVLPGDAADGKSLHDIYCAGCHDTGVYTRPDRRVIFIRFSGHFARHWPSVRTRPGNDSPGWNECAFRCRSD